MSEIVAPGIPPAPVTAPVVPLTEPVVPAPAAPPAVTPAAPAPSNPWDDPRAAQAEIEKLRRENAADRTAAKAAAADLARTELATAIGKILDPNKVDPTDPASLTTALTAQTAAAKQASLELAVYKAASTAKVDAAALLDSRSFLDQVAAIDPTDTAALEAAIATATTSNPRLKVTQAAAVGGADLTGGAGTVRTYSRAQLADPAFYQANKTDILAAYSEGRITP